MTGRRRTHDGGSFMNAGAVELDLSDDIDALTMGLYLALTAPSDTAAKQVSDLCDQVAARLTWAEVEHCKACALRLAYGRASWGPTCGGPSGRSAAPVRT